MVPTDLAAPSLRPEASDLGSRLVRYWPLKATGTPLGIALFIAAYFWIMHHPMFPVTVMPLTALDRIIPFDPRALPVYFSLWAYVSLAPALLRTRRELWIFTLGTAVLSAVGLGLFIVFPTAVPPANIDWTLYPSIEFLKDTDLALNACPSMHVAFSVFTMMWIRRVLWEMRAPAVFGWLSSLWCAAILYSTLATRQHVALDVLAGGILGAVVAGLHLRAVKPGQPD